MESPQDEPLKPGQTMWARLPDGVECRWRDDHEFEGIIMIGGISILMTLNVLLAPLALWKHGSMAQVWIAWLMVLYLWPQFLLLLWMLIRGYGRASRLAASSKTGLLYAPGYRRRPLLDVPREKVLEIAVEPRFIHPFARRWALNVYHANDRSDRRKYRLFGSKSRSRLELTAETLRAALQGRFDFEVRATGVCAPSGGDSDRGIDGRGNDFVP